MANLTRGPGVIGPLIRARPPGDVLSREPDEIGEPVVDVPGEPADLGDGEEDVLALLALG